MIQFKVMQVMYAESTNSQVISKPCKICSQNSLYRRMEYEDFGRYDNLTHIVDLGIKSCVVTCSNGCGEGSRVYESCRYCVRNADLDTNGYPCDDCLRRCRNCNRLMKSCDVSRLNPDSNYCDSDLCIIAASVKGYVALGSKYPQGYLYQCKFCDGRDFAEIKDISICNACVVPLLNLGQTHEYSEEYIQGCYKCGKYYLDDYDGCEKDVCQDCCEDSSDVSEDLRKCVSCAEPYNYPSGGRNGECYKCYYTHTCSECYRDLSASCKGGYECNGCDKLRRDVTRNLPNVNMDHITDILPAQPIFAPAYNPFAVGGGVVVGKVNLSKRTSRFKNLQES